MVDLAKTGTPWREEELDTIVADYFDMLAAEHSGQAYSKSRHNAVLMAQIGRSHRSVEFKHQNISAVLDELGLPWIVGYKPKKNYQSAILGVIERYLSQHPAVLAPDPLPTMRTASPSSVFVDPPAPPSTLEPIPAALRRLVRKFDPVVRDQRNRALGKAGEAFVVEVERQLLAETDRSDLARKVRWVAAEDGDGAGYDVLSFDPKGRERLIEVKTTNGSARTPFFLSRNECELSTERPEDWRIYRVHLYSQGARIFTIAPPLESAINLRPETWRASFG